jgi:hypothetical protein
VPAAFAGDQLLPRTLASAGLFCRVATEKNSVAVITRPERASKSGHLAEERDD